MPLKITPKSLIISILQVSGNEPLPIKALIVMGELFGFNSNSIRVTTARLLREGRIESDERGLYRLKDINNPIIRLVNNWRTGEVGVTAWDKSWTCCLMPKVTSGEQKSSAKALALLGFKEGIANLWARPHNLTLEMGAMKKLLYALGIHPSATLFVARDFNPRLTEQWQRYLWPVDELIRSCVAIQKKLEESSARLASMPAPQAVVESYLMGTEAVHWLTSDPCLPAEMMSGEYRTSLTRAMLEYDELGKMIWTKEFGDYRFGSTPAHLRVVTRR